MAGGITKGYVCPYAKCPFFPNQHESGCAVEMNDNHVYRCKAASERQSGCIVIEQLNLLERISRGVDGTGARVR